MGYPPPPPSGYPPPPPYWTPPPRIDPSLLQPTRTWYWLSAIPALVGVLLATVFAIQFVHGLDPDIDNFRTNRAAEVELNEGDRAIYVQVFGAVGARGVGASDLRCSVAFLGGSEPRALALDTTSGSTLDVNADRYISRFNFEAPADGRYRVACEGPEGVPLAVGPHLSFGLFAPLVFAIAAFVVGAGLTAGVAIVTAVKRSNHKKRLQRGEAV